jgi:hypothetical protein
MNDETIATITLPDLITEWGTQQKIADWAGIRQSSVSEWGKHGVPRPWQVAFRLHLRAERAEARHRCDGNHGGPSCADPECWARG